MESGEGIALLEPVSRVDIFLAAFDDIPDPRADNARHDLGKLLVVGFVKVRVRQPQLGSGPIDLLEASRPA